MFDGDDCCHSISYICTCKIRIFFFEDSQFPGIGVDHRGKYCLESRNMSTTFRIINIVAEPQYVLMKFIYILKSHFYGNPFAFPLKIHHLMECFLRFIQIFYESYQPVRLMVFNTLHFTATAVFKDDGQIRVQICSFMHTALDLFCLEAGLLKDLRIGQKTDLRSRLSGLTKRRKQSMFQFNGWIAPLVVVMMYISVSVHLYIQPGGQRIYNRRTYSVKSSAGLICRIIKLSTCMQCGKYQSLRRHSLCMHSNWNTTSIICDRTGTIFFQIHFNLGTISCQMLIH